MLSLFSFQGRLNRLQFLACYLMQIGVVVVAALVAAVGVLATHSMHSVGMALVLFLPVLLASVWMYYATSWKRMADIGVPRSLRRTLQIGWTIVGAVIMAALGHTLLVRLVVGAVPFLMLALWPGQPVDEDIAAHFGPPPTRGPSPPPRPAPQPYKPAPAPAAYRPPPPLQPDGRPVFGRRGL